MAKTVDMGLVEAGCRAQDRSFVKYRDHIIWLDDATGMYGIEDDFTANYASAKAAKKRIDAELR